MGEAIVNFVWLFEGKGTEELEMSVGLVKKFHPDAHITIISSQASAYNFAHLWLEPSTVLPNKHADQLFKLNSFIDMLPDEFYVMNDDFFILSEMQDDGDIHGRLSDLLRNRKVHDTYYKAIENTIEMLDELQLPLWNFELHKPLRVDKNQLVMVIRLLRSEREAILWRSLYGNVTLLGREVVRTSVSDVKNIPFGSSWCLSTDGYSYPRYRSKLRGVLNG